MVDEAEDAVPRGALSRPTKRLVRWLVVRFIYRLTDIVGKTQQLLRAPPSLPPAQDAIRHILVVRVDLLGDLVMTLPALDALRARWPLARIAVLCTPAAAEIAARCAAVDAVYAYNPNVVRSPRWWLQPAEYGELLRLVARLRAERFDLAMSMHGEFACLLAWASGARHRVGYAQEGYPALLTLPVPGRRYLQPFGHEVQWNEHLTAMAGAPSQQTVPRLLRRDDETAWLATFTGCAAGHGYVVLAPGAHNGSAKRYLLPSWATVANALAASHGVRIVLSGTASELPLVRELAAQLDVPPLIAAGETNVCRLLALLGNARLLLAGDSGPVHLAAALGTPVVAVFGPTDPRVYRPYTDRSTIIRAALPCSPCYDSRTTAECRLGYDPPLCMTLVPAARVLAAARRWLDGGKDSQDAERRPGTLDHVQDVVLPLAAG
ncbi:MAG: glycosyltransferase family 9 protein [Chloroflexota bacterium]